MDIGIAADVGTLQRFPKIVGNDSLVRELAFTARKFYAAEAKSIGFVSRLFVSREAMLAGAMDIASSIAAKSPVAVQGTKVHLNYSRDHSVEEGLDHMVGCSLTYLLRTVVLVVKIVIEEWFVFVGILADDHAAK